MTIMHDKEYRGRKMRVGSIIFSSTGRLNYFMGYCPDCKGKCTVTPDEAKILIRRFGSSRRRPVQRIVKRLLVRYASDV